MSHDAHLRLEHERESRLSQLQAMQTMRAMRATQAGDGAGHEAEGQVMLAQKDTIERVLKEIEAALARVRDGSYGTCPTCAKPIPVERLEILPYTQFCVPCQRRTG
ncbi:TraR/DksA C4-type zinc finger protein [Streptomyces sp. NPDC050439]|uniref:TraR/DksA family transcriptional regulator n=1 Tax=unclassified Streptomyces TaxID=2593676 RepID=UPI0034249B0D